MFEPGHDQNYDALDELQCWSMQLKACLAHHCVESGLWLGYRWAVRLAWMPHSVLSSQQGDGGKHLAA